MPPSKQIVDRTKDSIAVLASVNAHARLVETRLGELLKPHLRKGETMPDVSRLLELIARVVEARTEVMTGADTSHQTELADDEGFRRQRDERTADLVTIITQAREALDGVYGSGAIQRYGIKGTTPRDPAQLVAFATAMAQKLHAEALPAPRFTASVDRKAIAAEIRAGLAPLQDAIDHVAREVREAEGTLVARDAAVETFDATFSRAAATFVALYRLAGEDELAARIRPSVRRPGRLAQALEEGTSEDAPLSGDANAS